MDIGIKLSSNLAPFSRLSDRFVPGGYCDGYEFNKQLGMLRAVDGIQGVALGWPGPYESGTALKRILAEHGLHLSTLEPNIYGERRFKHGALSNPDPVIRRAAIDRIKETIDAALEAGASDINLWPGQDGFEYCFQGHYHDVWKWILEGLTEISEYNPRMPISVEYKCKEPRANVYIANMGKALMLVNRINKPHVGVTLDMGHSLAALENPAECAVLAMHEGRLQQIHLNDNYRDWDHDMIPGSVNVWEHVEFFYWVRRLGYSGWFSIDCFPYRENGTEALERTVEICSKCIRMADRLIKTGIDDLFRENRHLEIMRQLWDMVG
ncbi:MAG: sugar phosphate isomerase/epimerase family protein [Bryobacteraceae bacterium]